IDLSYPRLFLTNAVGRLAPRAVTRCIGSDADNIIAPYIFDRAPDAHVEGSVPLGFSDGTENLRFELDGGPFHWQRFNLERIRGTVWRRGYTLDITNVVGHWHGADVTGWAHFDFTPRDGDRFKFIVRVDHADLHDSLRDLQPDKTNRVEGTVSGLLQVNSADT